MRRRTPATLAVALCCVLAGCGGFGASSVPTETATPTSTPERPDGSVIAYSSLSTTEQTAFDDAVANGSVVFGPESPALDTDVPLSATTPFYEHEYVERNGTYYEVSLTNRGMVASYSIQTEAVASADNETVVAFENVTGEHTEFLRLALENGSHYVPPGTTYSLDISVDGGEFVEYRGTTYRVQIAVGDIPTWKMTVEED